MTNIKKYVYMFNEGNAQMRNELGGKGANLCEMYNLNIPVPYGFTISTSACLSYYEDGKKLNSEIINQINKSIEKLEKETGKKFGSSTNPLLVSVRSGARVSMPGMMDTVLNLGLNDDVVLLLAKTANEWMALDSYRRFIQMFSDVVMGIDKSRFEAIISEMKKRENIKLDTEFSIENLKELILSFKNFYKENTNNEFPQNLTFQLYEAIKAVFKSWNTKRAIFYRQMHDISSDWGTAVNVQTMVFGNMGETSGTGVAFTRNPSTGEKKLFGEFLMNAQGEDIVAGVRTPLPISQLEKVNKKVYNEFKQVCNTLEKNYKDMQDMEFSIENGKLYMLQTRNGKRTAQASLKIAVDMVKEKLITEKEALLKLDSNQFDQLLHPTFDKKILESLTPISIGLPASPGSASGYIATSSTLAKKMSEAGKKVILVRQETSPEDIIGMNVSNGILTARGGMTSHAAVLARGFGRCCIAGCGDLIVDESKGVIFIKGKKYSSKDYISLDGTTGKIYAGKIDAVDNILSPEFIKVMKWANKYKRMEVRANADTVSDATIALKYGATGIGLVRTEHMFFSPERILKVREMILSETYTERVEVLKKLEKIQEEDFYNIMKVMKGYPVIIRLLDPPLHEFLPKTVQDIVLVAKALKKSKLEIKNRTQELKEFNPMMGHRGCRLSVTYPEITQMQTRAIISASLRLKNEKIKVLPEIMIPLIVDEKEFRYVKNLILSEANKMISENSATLKYTIGSMIETPRATQIADKLAKDAKFFSFGTNDLTQLTYGFSRDDAGKFLPSYYDKKIFDFDPFTTIDTIGVGRLINTTVIEAKMVNPTIECGICGEHGGNPQSIEFCEKIGLDYVSCSPYRVAIAILSAAQATIKNENK